ncbi:MAG: LVIVD repeat-containing protein [Kofleriaceae bacterium]
MRALAVVGLLAACGDNLAPRGRFEIVGHHDLGALGMWSAIAAVDDYVYVGSRNDQKGIQIVDVSDPSAPVIVGEVGPPSAGIAGMSTRELRIVPSRNLLIVLNLRCSPDLHGCGGPGEGENLRFFDISDREAPVLLSTYAVNGTMFRPRSPHEFFVWADDTRVLVYLTAPPAAPSFEVIDATDPTAPKQLATWDPGAAGLMKHPGGDDILHSVSVSRDGTRAYLSHQQSGLLIADVSALPTVTLVTPPDKALTWEPPLTMGPHSAVPMQGRDLLVVTEEIYPMPFGTGCPWGSVHIVDFADPAALVEVGQYKLPENDPSYCSTPRPNITYTAHNVTTTEDLALVTWYAGGLQAIDVSDPTSPQQLAELRPEPLPAVAVEDPALGGAPIEMWSYPIIKDGLIYVVDARNGLYVLSYHGRWAEQIAHVTFREGNSNL